MTDNKSKLRALFLSALMVFSVFAGTVALSGGAAAAVSGNIDSFDTVFQGEEITVNNLDNSYSQGDILQIRQGIYGDGDGERVATATVDSNGVATFDASDTGDLAEDFHFFRIDGTNVADTQFNVVEQDWDVSWYGGTYYTSDSASDNGLNIEGGNGVDVRSSYTVTVNETDLNQSELMTVFGGEASATTANPADNPNNPIELTVDESGTNSYDVDFSSLDTGDYEFTVASQISDKESTINATYSDAEVSASFSQNVYNDEVGDVASFTVNLDQTSSATVDIEGDEYSATMVVNDGANGDEDGEVTVNMNSYLAGQVDDNTYTAADSANDSVDFTASSDGTDLTPYRLASGSFDLTTTVGGEEQDVATLSLNERSTDALTTHVAPSGDFDNAESVSDILDAQTESDSVAFDDGNNWADDLAFQVQASGIYAYLEEEVLDGTATADGLTLELERQGSQYSSAQAIDLSASQFELVEDADNNRFFVVVSPEDVGSMAVDGEYEVTFTLNSDNNDYVDEDESVSSTFGVVQAEDTFSTVEEPYQVVPENGTEVRGESTRAPGTELRVQAIKSGSFLQPVDGIVVQEDGTWNTTFDFGDREVGEEFELRLRGDYGETVNAVFSDTPEWETTQTDEQLEQEIAELETLLNETMDELEQKNATIEELRQQLNESGASQELLDEKNATIAELENQTEQLNQDLAQAESDLLNSTTTIADLNEEVNALNLSVRTLEAENADLQNQTESLQSMLDDANSTIDEQQSTIDERDSTISDLEDEIAELEEEAETTTASGPGFTAVLALVALMGAALLAVRRQQ